MRQKMKISQPAALCSKYRHSKTPCTISLSAPCMKGLSIHKLYISPAETDQMLQSALPELWFSVQVTLDSCGPQNVFFDESSLFYHVTCVLNVFLRWVFPGCSKSVFSDSQRVRMGHLKKFNICLISGDFRLSSRTAHLKNFTLSRTTSKW